MSRIRFIPGKLLKHERLYVIWCNMKSRCYDSTREAYKYYGAKGIKLCKEWENDFMSFYHWAKSNGYQEHLTIDRIKSTDDYSPSTCQWITRSENSKRQSKSKRALTESQVLEIRNSNNRLRHFADKFSVSINTIYQVKNNVTYKEI